jgi:hypothetical protein
VGLTRSEPNRSDLRCELLVIGSGIRRVRRGHSHARLTLSMARCWGRSAQAASTVATSQACLTASGFGVTEQGTRPHPQVAVRTNINDLIRAGSRLQPAALHERTRSRPKRRGAAVQATSIIDVSLGCYVGATWLPPRPAVEVSRFERAPHPGPTRDARWISLDRPTR